MLKNEKRNVCQIGEKKNKVWLFPERRNEVCVQKQREEEWAWYADVLGGCAENAVKQMIIFAVQNDPWACNREDGYGWNRTKIKETSQEAIAPV